MWDNRNHTFSASKWGIGQFANEVVNHYVPQAEYSFVQDIVNRTTQSISEPEVAELERVGDAYVISIHQEEPLQEQGFYQRVEVTMTCATYYGVKFRQRWATDPPQGKLWLPDTWDPQHFVEAEVAFNFISSKFAFITFHFNLAAVVAARARVWLELWLPVDIGALPQSSGGVAFAGISVSLLQNSAALGRHELEVSLSDSFELLTLVPADSSVPINSESAIGGS